MCGLITVIQASKSGFDVPLKNSLWPMLLLNSLRGPHSTGMAGIEIASDKTQNVDIVKRAGSPYSLLLTAEARKFMGNVFNKYVAVMAHGRWATRGAITSQNAHPFMTKNVTLIHNGSIHNLHKFDMKDVDRQVSVGTFFDVDSAGVTYLMETIGPEETLKQIEGAFAFIWHDRRTGKIHAVRNHERPLFMAFRENPVPAYILASDPLVIKQAADRFDMKLTEPAEITPRRMLSFTIDGSAAITPEVKDVEFYKPPVYVAPRNNRNMWTGYENPERIPFQRVMDRPEIYPLRDIPTQEKPRITGTDISDNKIIEVGGATFQVDDIICFYPNDLNPIGPVTRDLDNNRFFVSGFTADTEHVAVAAWIKGTPLHLKDESLLVGRIVKIRTAPDLGQDKYRVIVGDLRVPPEELAELAYSSEVSYRPKAREWWDLQIAPVRKRIIELPDNTKKTESGVYVTLKNGKALTVEEFESIAKLGCIQCTRDIYLPDAPGCEPATDSLRKGKSDERRFVCPHCTGTHILAH